MRVRISVGGGSVAAEHTTLRYGRNIFWELERGLVVDQVLFYRFSKRGVFFFLFLRMDSSCFYKYVYKSPATGNVAYLFFEQSI